MSLASIAAVVDRLVAPLPPRRLLAAAAAVMPLTIAALAFVPDRDAMAVNTLQQVVVSLVAAVAVLAASARTAQPARRLVARGMSLTLAAAGIAMFLWYLDSYGIGAGAGPGNVLLVACVVVLVVVLARAIFRGMSRPRTIRIALDTAVLLLGTATVVALTWHRLIGGEDLGPDEATVIFVGTLTVAGPIAALLALIDRGVRPRLRGPYAVLAGIGIAGVDLFVWQSFIAASTAGNPSLEVNASNWLFSVTILLCAHGAMTWDLEDAGNVGSRRLAQAAGDLFPLGAVGLCVALLVFAPAEAVGQEIVRFGTGGVVVLALVRQMYLTVDERRAREAERAASAQLGREIRTRAVVLRSLVRNETRAAPDAMARDICEEALALEGVDSVAITVFQPDGGAVVLAGSHLEDLPAGMRGAFPPPRAAELRVRASGGAWTETARPDTLQRQPGSMYGPGVRSVANAPIVWNERVLGVIGMATRESASPEVVAERQATAAEFGVVTGALLGPALDERDRIEALRQSISDVISREAFHPVFQPIVDLPTGRAVGFEALTRFDDGRRPDLWFADAASSGLGVELEVACLRAAVDDATSLPPDTYLSVNASPELAAALVPLLAALESADRAIVVEITEQVKVGSYAGLRDSLATLRGHMRIAVDDAGAGYAGLQHILEIRPHIVKLDIALVRGVNHDAARRALIASMVAFAAETGCNLLAEGIETEAELATLRALGVTLGQGYLLGRPAPIADVTGANAANTPADTEVAGGSDVAA